MMMMMMMTMMTTTMMMIRYLSAKCLVSSVERHFKGPFTQAIFVAATQCNFCRAEVATSCDFIAILVQFVSVNVSTRLLLKQKLCAY